MNRLFLCSLSVVFILLGCGAEQTVSSAEASPSDVDAQVRATLAQQIADWNRGDVDAFMQSYWQDPNVRFASGGDIKRGWANVLAQYKVRYPDKSAMGALMTAELDVTALADDAALAFGRWIVTAGGEDYCGLFSLVLRRVDGRWVIVHDHTSDSGGVDAAGRTCSAIKQAALNIDAIT